MEPMRPDVGVLWAERRTSRSASRSGAGQRRTARVTEQLRIPWLASCIKKAGTDVRQTAGPGIRRMRSGLIVRLDV